MKCNSLDKTLLKLHQSTSTQNHHLAQTVDGQAPEFNGEHRAPTVV